MAQFKIIIVLTKIYSVIKENRWLILIFLFHIILVNNFFQFNRIFDNRLIINDDYPTIFYKSTLMKLTLSQGKIEAYVPFFYGGYSLSESEGYRNFLAEDKVPTILYFLFSSIPNLLIFKFYIFTINLIFPFIIYLVARNFGLKNTESTIAAILTVLIWQFNVFFHERFYTGGEINFILVSSFSLLAISIFYKYLTENKIKYLYSFIILCFFTILMHVFTIIIMTVPFLSLCYFLYKKKPNQVKSIFFALCILAVLVTMLSLELLKGYVDSYKNILSTFQTEGWKSVFGDIQNDLLYITMLLLGFYGIFFWRGENDKIKFVLFLFSMVFYFVYAYFGSFLNLTSATYPKRFIIPLNFFLVIPSAMVITKIYGIVKNNKKYLLIFVLIILIILPSKTPELFTKINFQMKEEWNRRITTDISKDTSDIVSWIKENTTPQARVLIEDSGYESDHKHGGGHISYLPLYTEREFIGGPYPYRSIILNVKSPDFYEGILFNKNVSEYSETELKYYFDLFNIKWIISWSDESKRTFEKYPQLISKSEQIGQFSIYETAIKPSFFVKGDGTIKAQFNNITVTDAVENMTIIKYRYQNGLKIDGGLKIEEYKLKGFRWGFISVSNGNVSSFKICI